MSNRNGIGTRPDTAWGTSLLGPDGRQWEGAPSLATNRDRARRLERESALAHALLDRSDENVIGTGIVPVPKSSSPKFNAEITALLAQWMGGKTADIRRTYSFGQLQRLGNRHRNRDGDCGFILIDRTDEGFRFPELQFVAGEHIATPTGVAGADRSKIVDGIEFNEVNAPVAYWIRTAKGFERVEARDFIFLHNSTRYNVARGDTKFHGLYRLFDQLEGFVEAVVVAARIGASQAMIAKTAKGQSAARQVGLKSLTAAADGSLAPAKIIEPGMINYIGTDEEIVPFNPSQPQQTFTAFLTSIARLLGLKFGLTVERVLLDFSGASYSVARSTAIQEMQAAWPAQDDFNASFLARVYPWFVEKCIELGYVESEPPEDRWNYDWVPPGRPLNDNVKEAAGFELLMKLGLASPEAIATSMGEDWEKLKATIRKNKRELEELGIAWPTDAPSATALLAGEGGGTVAVGGDGTASPALSPREQVDAYGIGVRAGVVTPQVSDEEALRKVLSLPEMSDAAKEAWKKDGIRRPITIAGAVEAAAEEASPAGGETEQ